MKEDHVLLNSDKRELRKELIKSIYDNDVFNTALLSALDLEIYDKSDELIPKLNKAIRQSILNSDIYLTNEQMECLSLLEDNSLFISAPTSFGKTYIALEYISRHIDLLNNIVFIVPTVSLMNELRKKCYKYFDKNSFNYSRFASHMQYLFRRKSEYTEISSTNKKLFELLKNEYPMTYQCVLGIKELIFNKFNWNIGDEELLYLILHVNRLCSHEGVTNESA